jgi:phosphatidylinositol-3-phosphatase
MLFFARCGGGSPSASTPSSTPTSPPATTASGATFNHVFLVVLENMGYSDVAGSPDMPYLNSLTQKYAVASNYYANTHPSIGNYFMMTTGQIVTNDDAFTGTVGADNVVRELAAAGKSWKSYAENLPSAGYTGGDQLPYIKRHNPIAYFTDVVGTAAAANLVPFGNLSADLSSGAVPNFVYMEPNMYDDMHNCPPGMSSCTLADRRKFCDAWLQANLAPILSNSAFTNNGLLILTFDEGIDTDSTNGGGHILTVLMSPRAKPGFSSTTLYQHQSLLRLMLEGLGVSALPGAASSAPKMTEFFQ